MRAASYHHSAYGSRTSFRSRITSALLALAVGVGLFFALLTLGVLPDRSNENKILATFDVRPPAPVESRSARRAAATPTRRTATPPPLTPPVPPPPVFPPEMIILTSQQFAAADIGRIKPSPNEGAGADGAAETADSGTGDSAVGKGPDGQPLYNAQWYREPTRAEMATYMPKRSVGGDAWGLIICKTVERYRVEDCRELGESPGSGLSGAMRQAAWQFLVRPPRVGGRPLIGAWVRIRFDMIEAKE